MTTVFNACPDCGTALQAFYVKSADAQVLLEIDGCRRCRGLWFDRGELERAVGRRLEMSALGGVTDRKCARCRRGLETLLTDDGIPIEHCPSCRGVFLDAGELAQLGAPEAEAPAEEALRGSVDFQCLECHGRFPVTQGNAMREGLVCGNCVPRPGELPLEKYLPDLMDDDDAGPLGRRSRGGAGMGFVLGFLDDIF